VAVSLDGRIYVGISVPSRIVFRCVDATLRLSDLSYHFLSSPDEILKASGGFAEISSHSVNEGCVGALDGMRLRIMTPRRQETGNIVAYFSGHYQDYGINVQAVCDSPYGLIHVALAAPEGAKNIAALRNTTLPGSNRKIYHWVTLSSSTMPMSALNICLLLSQVMRKRKGLTMSTDPVVLIMA
jgi:hypothetical protein